jgi:hypothetical protein
MSLFIAEPSRSTPQIRFDLTGKQFYIKGKSFPENSKKFYLPLNEWLSRNKLPADATIEMHFDYISSSSVIAVLEVLKNIESHGIGIKVIWTYEEGDDDLLNVAMNYQRLCALQIELNPVD